MDLYEALYTTRAMRRVKPDPIPDEVVASILDAGIRAPSAGNTQNWRFVVVTDRELMRRIGEWYAEAWDQLTATLYAGMRERAAERGDTTTQRVMNSAEWLAANFAHVPLLVLPFHRNDPDGSSIYPAVWNLMLAARGHGIGATLTTVLHHFKHDEVCGLIGVPTDKGWKLAAAIPMGYPLGQWGIAERPPVTEVTYAERWGEPPTWTAHAPLWPPRP
jgi:nitroreductase